MPPVLIPILASAGLGGTAFTIGATAVSWATIGAYAITTAASLALSLLLQPKAEKRDPSQMQVKQAIPARRRGYGRAKLAGSLVFMETKGGTLHQAIVHSEGPITRFEEWWFNDQKSPTVAGASAGGAGVDPWYGFVTFESHRGTASQTASPRLLAAFPGLWTSSHRLRGLAYSVLSCALPRKPEKNFQKNYPNGAPSLRVVAQMAEVYDPRTGGAAWSDNAALCIRDYLVHPRGFNIPAGRINNDSFAAFANICDQPIPLKAGGTEPRYRLGGTYDLTEEPREVLRKMLLTCDAEIVPLPDGTIGIRGGQWDEPTVTVDDSMITSYNYEQGSDRLAAFNRLNITYISPAHDYQPTETQAWDDLANQTLTGEALVQDLTLDFVQWHGQARRLAKIGMAKGNPRHKLQLVTNLAGLDALGERTVHVHLAELGIDEPFLITNFEIAGDMTGCTVTLASLDASAYAWNAAAEEGSPPGVPQDTAVVIPPPLPTGVAVSLVRKQIMVGTWESRIRATVNALTDDNATFQTIGRYRKQGDTDWIDMVADGDWAVISGTVEDGSAYDVQVAHAGWGGIDSGNIGAWSSTQTITATSDPVPPSPPSSLAASVVSGSNVSVSWINPNSGNYYATRVYRGTSTIFGAATYLGEVYGTPFTAGNASDIGLSPGTYRYWVVAINRSGTPSLEAGPVSVTTT